MLHDNLSCNYGNNETGKINKRCNKQPVAYFYR